MSEIRSLLWVELRSFFDINKALHTKDQKAKSRYRGLCVAWAMVIVMICTYVGGLVLGLCSLGLGDIVPAYLATVSSMIVLVFGIFSAGNKIFSQKGYDILVALPIKPSAIVTSRFLSLYIGDLFFTALVMLPGVAVYGYCVQPPLWFYALAFVGLLVMPIIPLVITVLIGSVVMAISSRMKKKSLAQTVLMVAVTFGAMLSSFTMGNITENATVEQLANLAQAVGSAIERIYIPAVWFNNALIKGDILSFALFCAVSCAIMAIVMLIVIKNFEAILHRLQNFGAKHDYKIDRMTGRSAVKALYLREAKRYFASSVYVTNTIIGPIMGMIIAIALAAVGVDTIASAMPVAIDVAGLMPFAVAAVFCMMPTTATAISMEGKQIWIIKSLPIPMKTLLDSKLLFNLSLMLPFYVVSVVALAIVGKADIIGILWIMLIPASMMLFSVVFGITVNLKFHSFDWENEVTVVKQSLPAAIGGFVPFFVSMLCCVAVAFVPMQYGDIAKAAVCVLLLGSAVMLYKFNNKKSLAML